MSNNKRDAAGITSILRSPVLMPAYFVGLGAFLVVGLYVAWLGGWHGHSLSAKTDDWGTFGDYVGGVLNPVCAYMAFIWLVRSYALQKTELAETRKTLHESHKAQLLQAKISYAAARIETANVRINYLNTQAELYRLKILNLQKSSNAAMESGMPIEATDVFHRAHVTLAKELAEIERLQSVQVQKIAEIEEELTRSWGA